MLSYLLALPNVRLFLQVVQGLFDECPKNLSRRVLQGRVKGSLETRPQGGKAAWGILFACATVLIILKTLDNEPYRLASA